jgi:hypothetical protein
MGRPSEFTEDKADAICERLADGESLRSICLDTGMPSQPAVFRWLAANETFRKQYAIAREAQADSLFDEMLDIADDTSLDTRKGKDGDEQPNTEWITRSRLRVETRKWMAGKLRPKVYGDKIDVEHGGSVSVQIVRLADQ